eukprot:2976640-Ditylum_brightwellii.AAC.1
MSSTGNCNINSNTSSTPASDGTIDIYNLCSTHTSSEHLFTTSSTAQLMAPIPMVNNFIQPAHPIDDGGTPCTHCHGDVSMPDSNRAACILCSAYAFGAGVSRTLNVASPMNKDSSEEIDKLWCWANLDCNYKSDGQFKVGAAVLLNVCDDRAKCANVGG